jgi:hypothetical protein
MSVPGPPRRAAPLWIVAVAIVVAGLVVWGLISLGARKVPEPSLSPIPSVSSS